MEKILGQALRKEREARGVSLADIAAETRIGTRFLNALEEEDFDLFPGSFYIHYYIKNYLQACGADETAFFNTYQPYLNKVLKREEALSPDQYMHKMAYVKFSKRRRTLLLILLLGILGLMAFLVFGRPRLMDKVLGRAPEAIDVPAISSYLLEAREDFCLTAAPLRARLSLEAPCWLQLWRGGEKVAERTFRTGEVITLEGYQLTMVIARPQALRLQLNGREVSFFRDSPVALKLAVDPLNLQDILKR
ncbi:MAG: DUF4115 domain-containing protein [Candidatus Aminicenantes bacterium]|nr:DUF4115 domain-containing protein [Candidatus Aminicenantes bacterium]